MILSEAVLHSCCLVSFVHAKVFSVVLFCFPRKTLQFQWTGTKAGTFFLETNISGEQIIAVYSVI